MRQRLLLVAAAATTLLACGHDAPSPTPATAAVAPSPSAGCSGDAPLERDYTLTLTHDGRQRTALVHLPPAYDGTSPLPLVFNNHGNVHSAQLQAKMSGLAEHADPRGVITVAPQGTGQVAGWNVGNSPLGDLYADVDDVGFFGALLDELERTRCVDRARVYCTGFSLGGSMCYRLACDMSDRIVAIASVSGPDGTVTCEPSRPASVLHFHGTADHFADYKGDGAFNKGVLSYVPAHAKRAGCSDDTTITLERGAVTCRKYSGCRAGLDVGYCTIDGFGHSWPGGTPWAATIPVNEDIDASAMILDFFLAHAR